MSDPCWKNQEWVTAELNNWQNTDTDVESLLDAFFDNSKCTDPFQIADAAAALFGMLTHESVEPGSTLHLFFRAIACAGENEERQHLAACLGVRTTAVWGVLYDAASLGVSTTKGIGGTKFEELARQYQAVHDANK